MSNVTHILDRVHSKATSRPSMNGLGRVALDDVDIAVKADDTTLLRSDEALDKLAQEDPLSAKLVKLRFFAGLNNEQGRPSAGHFRAHGQALLDLRPRLAL